MSALDYGAYDAEGKRKYLTKMERIGFIRAAAMSGKEDRLFCETMYYLGCRVSEAIALSKDDVDPSTLQIRVRCMKKRGKVIFRRLPVPERLAEELAALPGEMLWSFSRQTAWRIIKRVMAEAGISGIQATPRGLRHAFGVRCAMAKTPVNKIQAWMGHASPLTTAIYLDIQGIEERELMERTWD